MKAQIDACRSRVQQALETRLPPATSPPKRLHEAMRYAVLGAGKRIRPVLVYATGQLLGAADELLDTPACAVELIHAYSLVHDDLPAMDDDDLRRGRATCHRAFDEATALLAGDALQTLAFEILSAPGKHAPAGSQRAEMVSALASASGCHGMAGGQAIDLAAVGRELDLAELEYMHIHKTGALIRASVRLGALCHPDPEQQELLHLDRYAEAIGLAFQIRDDILDVEGDTEVLGKRQGADAAHHKPTYTSLLGLAAAKERALDLHQQALANLRPFGERAALLRWISEFIVTRST